jgi:transposase
MCLKKVDKKINFIMSKSKVILRQRRIFSVELKKQIVKDIEQGKMTVQQTCREYSIVAISVYRWIEKFSHNLQRGTVLIMQKKSDATQKEELLKKIKELEAALGRKQLELEVKEKIIEFASEELGVDIKKKYATGSLNTSQKKDPKEE